MKKLSFRSLFALVLAAILATGTVFFTVTYFFQAEEWVTFPGSPHLYSGSNLSIGVVTDRDGTILLDATEDMTYAADAQTRASTLHLLGDREGFIYAPLLSHYADRMLSYNRINGLYTLEEITSTATLTISTAAQNAALRALNGRRGVVAVYNYETGEILCAVSSPTYDPDNIPNIEGDSTGTYKGVYVNRFFDATYTPGSIMKLLTTAAALEAVEDVEEQTFICPGTLIIAGQEVICEGTHNEIDLQRGLAVSCNCVFGELAVEVGADTLQSYAEQLGLVTRHTCDGNRSVAGTFDLSSANDGDLAWAGIGQYTDQVTAYAFLRFMGILGGGGEAAEPHFMASVTCGGKETYRAEPVSTGRLLKRVTADTMQELMRYNVEHIYGTDQFGSLTVCAKSGTAEVEGQPSNAMFAGFVAEEDCPLAFVVFLEEAGRGSTAAAPVAASVLAVCAAELGK